MGPGGNAHCFVKELNISVFLPQPRANVLGTKVVYWYSKYLIHCDPKSASTTVKP